MRSEVEIGKREEERERGNVKIRGTSRLLPLPGGECAPRRLCYKLREIERAQVGQDFDSRKSEMKD